MRKATTLMVHRIAITKARINLGQLVSRPSGHHGVHAGQRVHLNKEYFILEKDGIPVAGIIDVDELEDYLELQNPEVQRQIEKSNEDIRAGQTRPARDLLAELDSPPKRKTRQRQKA